MSQVRRIQTPECCEATGNIPENIDSEKHKSSNPINIQATKPLVIREQFEEAENSTLCNYEDELQVHTIFKSNPYDEHESEPAEEIDEDTAEAASSSSASGKWRDPIWMEEQTMMPIMESDVTEELNIEDAGFVPIERMEPKRSSITPDWLPKFAQNPIPRNIQDFLRSIKNASPYEDSDDESED